MRSVGTPEIVAIGVGLLAVLVAIYSHRRGPRPLTSEELTVEVHRLKTEMEKLREENEGLHAVNDSLMRRVVALEQERHNWQLETIQQSQERTSARPALSVVVVIGPDRELDVDLAVFRKLQAQGLVSFRRLRPGNSKALERYLERKRMDKHPTRYVHFSLHGNREGLLFEDGVLTGIQLSELLQGVEVLFLDACYGDWVADLLGVVPVVVSLMEEIENRDAALLAEAFWGELAQTPTDPEGAYERALHRCPPVVSEFAELHLS